MGTQEWKEVGWWYDTKIVDGYRDRSIKESQQGRVFNR